MGMSEVHQCPESELRFATKWELEDHLAGDHPQEEEDKEGAT